MSFLIWCFLIWKRKHSLWLGSPPLLRVEQHRVACAESGRLCGIHQVFGCGFPATFEVPLCCSKGHRSAWPWLLQPRALCFPSHVSFPGTCVTGKAGRRRLHWSAQPWAPSGEHSADALFLVVNWAFESQRPSSLHHILFIQLTTVKTQESIPQKPEGWT